MYIDLLNNLAITSVLLFILGRFLQNNPLDFKALLKIKIYVGFISGVTGVVLMLNTIRINEIVILDVRGLAIIIAAVFGGPIAAIISGIIIGLMRILIFGVNVSSITACVIAVSMGIILGLFGKIHLSKVLTYILMNFTYVTVSSIAIYVIINNPNISNTILASYWLVSTIGAFFTYFFIQYIIKSNEDHRSVYYYKQITENATDLLSTHNLDGKFKYLSPSSIHLIKYAPEELVGKNPYDYYHPEDLIDITSSHVTVIEKPVNSTIRYRFKRKDGEYIWLETISKMMKGILSENDEILCISRDITLQKQVEEQLRQVNSKLEELSMLDGLTNIPNRRAFDQRIDEEWKKMIRTQKPLSLVMFDIDHFKLYNDTYGHMQGDECIKQIVKITKRILHRPSDFIARYGGEEFIIILPETNQEGAFTIVEKIRKAIQTAAIVHVNSKVIPYVTVSLGIATVFPSLETNYTELLIAADDALYKAKNKGRNRVEA